MNRKHHITIDNLQITGLNPYKIIEMLADHILDNAIFHGEEDDEFVYLLDVLNDEHVRFESK